MDLGVLENGRLHVRGRLADVVNTGGDDDVADLRMVGESGGDLARDDLLSWSWSTVL
ncbi:long-chain fatty acid--CoA ligase [Actinomadura pelletieri]|uniref:long-chain fatty acid--CoA ligase n=1 Tax=Actinomadura pelletieri TaxID=111805 RepID=UPI0011C4218D|nr:long-chain fatty acid--CoA ligase [Actinomadura pelletieri]